MALSPHSVTPTLTPVRFARPMARGGLFCLMGNLVGRINRGFADFRQAIERMNKLIDDAHLDYPDQ